MLKGILLQIPNRRVIFPNTSYLLHPTSYFLIPLLLSHTKGRKDVCESVSKGIEVTFLQIQNRSVISHFSFLIPHFTEPFLIPHFTPCPARKMSFPRCIFTENP